MPQYALLLLLAQRLPFAPQKGRDVITVLREKRVARLGSGESISTSPLPRTVRDVSRFRILSNDGSQVTVRCAQNLREFRKDVLKHYTADVTFELVRSGGSFLIRRKIVRLINATDTLQGIGYIL